MSLVVFQSHLARLATDADFQRAVRREGESALGPGLDARERRRLVAISHDRGTRMTRTMYRGFRLAKLYATVPLLCRALGRYRTSTVLRYFATCRPFTFYFADEGVPFCDFIIASPPVRPMPRLLIDVARYERATLLLGMYAADGRNRVLTIPFAHDPAAVLGWALGRQAAPSPCPSIMHAALRNGEIAWTPRPSRPSPQATRSRKPRRRQAG